MGAITPPNIDPTFEELFQEQLQELLGPDPGATFRNIFSDIFTGMSNTPLETYVIGQFEELQNAFITATRAAAEQGRPVSTWEEFLNFSRPFVEERYQFTEDAAIQELDRLHQNLLNQGTLDPLYWDYIETNFNRLFRGFLLEAEDTNIANFGQYLNEQLGSLNLEFQLTRPAAERDLFALDDAFEALGIPDSGLQNFIESNFNELFSEFQQQAAVGGDPTTNFLEFIQAQMPSLEQQYQLTDPAAYDIFQGADIQGLIDRIGAGGGFEGFVEQELQNLIQQFQDDATARLQAGETGPFTFEQFLLDQLPNLEQQYNLTPGGIFEAFQGQNIQSSIQGSSLAGGGFESFVNSKLDELTAQFQEVGSVTPGLTFDQFFKQQLPELQRQYQFTDPGIQESFYSPTTQGLFGQFEGIPEGVFQTFIESQLQELAGRYQEQVGGAGGSLSFGQFIEKILPQLRGEFEFTQPGAALSLQSLFQGREAARGGGGPDPFERFALGEFETMFGEFSASSKPGQGPQTFADFFEQNLFDLQQQFSLAPSFQTGEPEPGSLAGLTRLQV